LHILAHYLVKIFATRNCHVDEMCETIWHERLKLSCNIRPFKNSRWKSTVWRRSEHYSINWQNIFIVSILRNPHKWSIIRIYIISVTRNCFCSRSSTSCQPFCLQFCQKSTDFKSFFTDRLSNIFVKLRLLKILPHLKTVATLPCDSSLITTLAWERRLFSNIGVLHGNVATRTSCDGIFNNSVIANLLENLAVKKVWKTGLSLWAHFETDR